MLETEKNSPKPKSTRWWPAVVVIAGFALALAVTWSTGENNQQYRVLRTLAAISISSLLLVTWALFFSRLAKRTRLLIFGGWLVQLSCFLSPFALANLAEIWCHYMSGAGPSAPCPRPTAKHRSQPAKRSLTPWPSCRSRSSSAQAATAKFPAQAWPPTER